MTNPILQIQNVQKSINKQVIIEPIELSLQKGEVLSLIGGNGAGKSTLIRMIVGITQPTIGEINVCGVQWKKDRHSYTTKIGYMPDDFNFGLALTARETLFFYAALKNVPKEQTEALLKEVGLEEVKNKKVSTYSKGMRQRLLFAQALLGDPELLVLDEPTNGLDPYWMDEFIRLVADRKQRGQTILFSTHQLEVAEAVSDRVIFLQSGKVLRQGTIQMFKDLYGEKGLSGVFTELYLHQNNHTSDRELVAHSRM